MRYILFLLTFCSSTTLFSQDFQASNIIEYQGEHNSHEVFHEDAMGNYFIAGQGTGAFDFDFEAGTSTLPTTSFRDLYLAKYKADNSLSWLLSFDGTVISNQIRAIVSDDEGNIYIAGSFSGRLNLTDDGLNEITSFGSSSMFVAKFDDAGNLKWQFTVGDSNFPQYPDELYISNNRLIIQFVYTGTFDVDPGPEVTELSGSSNAMLVYDLNGNFIEANSHTGNINVRTSIMDMDGNLYLGGSFGGLVSFDYKSFASVISSGITDAFLAKYDSDFNLVWIKMINKTFKNLRITQLDFDSNNDLIASAYFAADTEIGTFTTSEDANYLINISKEGDVENIISILPESCFITDLHVNSKDQIILNSTYSEMVDLDPTSEVIEITPKEDNSNFLLAVYDLDFNLTGYDQIHATAINTHSVHLNDTDQIMILTDYEGEGKVIFGHQESYMADGDEDFIFYQLDIEGCSSTMENAYIEGCNEVIVNGEVYTNSGQYEQVLANAEGCDSLLNLTIQIFPIEQISLMLEFCGPTIIEGETYSESGVYALELISSHGCDSIVTIDLEIVIIDKSITLKEGVLESLEEDADHYQWYECGSQIPIEGANEKTYKPEKDGTYEVEVTKKSCVERSLCLMVILTNTEDLLSDIRIFPNPTQDFIKIDNNNNNQLQVSLLDVSGRTIFSNKPLSSDGILDIGELKAGAYLLILEDGDRMMYKKVTIY